MSEDIRVLFLLLGHPVRQRSRGAFVDLGDEFGRRGVLRFHPRPLSRIVNLGQHLYADACVCAKFRLPDDNDLAVGVLLDGVLWVHAAKIIG